MLITHKALPMILPPSELVIGLELRVTRLIEVVGLAGGPVSSGHRHRSPSSTTPTQLQSSTNSHRQWEHHVSGQMECQVEECQNTPTE